jgi:L-ascorbate oxidase
VKLRGYVDRNRPPADGGRVIGPNIRVRPGDTVRMTLHNELPKDDPSCQAGADTHDTPGCFNNTNLHSHGLWVSPTGNSDNVLLDIKPGQSFPYEYNIPLDHPAGTFWYHPHRHGSTAIQVSSGMAGALIIEGNRPPGDRPEQTGDIDMLTRGMPEKLLVLDQTAYACTYQDGAPSPKPDGP